MSEKICSVGSGKLPELKEASAERPGGAELSVIKKASAELPGVLCLQEGL